MHTQNVRGLTSSVKFESLIDRMIQLNMHACCVQETWLIGNWTRKIQDFYVFHHNYDEKKKKGRVTGGVAIILSPRGVEAWKDAGSLPPIHVESEDFCGRFIGLTIKIKNRDSRRN